MKLRVQMAKRLSGDNPLLEPMAISIHGTEEDIE